ncbi:MAG: hypothetical protein JWM33_2114 [Caulobacteraceae bacterium]|nr:hypothetical protein [Caulobacteraceae bacterium]
MVDLNVEIGELWKALGAPAPGRPRIVQFIAARRGEGTSTLAREFARFAARRAGRRTWLIDLDLMGAAQCADIAAEPGRYGTLGGAVSGSPDGSAFFAIGPAAQAPPGAYLAAHKVGDAPWWVSRFRREMLKGRQNVRITSSGDYWQALRQHAEIIVVDSPSADRSQGGLAVAPHMDQTVLVVAADEHDVRRPIQLRDAISAAGGEPAGVFYNRSQVRAPPALLRAMLS